MRRSEMVGVVGGGAVALGIVFLIPGEQPVLAFGLAIVLSLVGTILGRLASIR